MKFKFSEITINYRDSFNLFEHLCIAVAFLEFIFFLIPRDMPLISHIYLVLIIPSIIYTKSKIRKKSNTKRIYKNTFELIFCIVLMPIIFHLSYSYPNLGICIDWNISIIIAIIFIIAGVISIYIRKDKMAPLKSLII